MDQSVKRCTGAVCSAVSAGGRLRDRAHFHFKNRATGRLQAHCKECMREYSAAWYRDNRELTKDRVDVRKALVRADLCRLIQEFKADKKCAECDKADHQSPLEFHHRDPQTKLANIADVPRLRWSRRKLFEEIEKCDLLCKRCHKAATLAQIKGRSDAEPSETVLQKLTGTRWQTRRRKSTCEPSTSTTRSTQRAA